MSIAFDKIIFENGISPFAKCGSAPGIDPITHRENNVQVVKLHIPGDGSFAFLLGNREYCCCGAFVDLILGIDISDMRADGIGIFFEEVTHLPL
jgi:hypothetical protein